MDLSAYLFTIQLRNSKHHLIWSFFWHSADPGSYFVPNETHHMSPTGRICALRHFGSGFAFTYSGFAFSISIVSLSTLRFSDRSLGYPILTIKRSREETVMKIKRNIINYLNSWNHDIRKNLQLRRHVDFTSKLKFLLFWHMFGMLVWVFKRSLSVNMALCV